MNKKQSRREAIKSIGCAGVATFLKPPSLTAQDAALRIAGQPVEIAISAVSLQTARISLSPIVEHQALPIKNDGSLVQQSWSPPVARIRTLAAARTVRCGDLTLKLSA